MAHGEESEVMFLPLPVLLGEEACGSSYNPLNVSRPRFLGGHEQNIICMMVK